ncbi:hypothetical protein HYZ98_01355 [Candidatus Peregrinibacteria bacterium]|nr:hypothetical protein [Candidatus Peregrinibacteria bacterium]
MTVGVMVGGVVGEVDDCEEHVCGLHQNIHHGQVIGTHELDADEHDEGSQNGFHHGQGISLHDDPEEKEEEEKEEDESEEDEGKEEEELPHPESGQQVQLSPLSWQLVPGVKQGPPQLAVYGSQSQPEED